MEKSGSSEKLLRSGLTPVTVIALLYAIFVFQPAMVWLSLTTGGGLGAISWITVIIFAEIMRLSGKPISKQEATIIFLLAAVGGSMAGTPFFINMIYRAYYAQSPIAKLFGIADEIPRWWASTSIEAWQRRTFLHPSWTQPIIIGIIMLILGEAVNLSMGLITREIYIRSMKLPFPMQEVSAVGIATIVEPEQEKRTIFLIGSLFGIIYGFILYGPPILNQLLTGVPSSAPIPWADMNEIIQTGIPGASFGIATSLLTLIGGFILPFSTVVSILAGSVALYMIANPLLVSLRLTGFAEEYFYGMSIADIMYRTNLHAWAGPLVGVALGAAVIPLLQARKAIAAGFRSLSKIEKGGLSVTSLPVLLAIWLGSSVASVAITYMLIPAGIIYLLVMLGFSVGWSFIWTMINAYSLGVTGLQIGEPRQVIPIFKYSYISTGFYQGKDIWFMDPIIGTGGAGWCGTFKVCELNDTDPISLIKVFLLVLPIVTVMGFVYVQNFWSIAPIPSVMYQYTAIYWPISATNDSLWIAGRMFTAFDPIWVAGAFALTLAGGIIIAVLKIPASIIGLAVGVNTAIPYAVTIFLGGIIGRFIEWRIGRDWWRRNRMVLSAGLSLGESTSIIIVSVIGMITRSLWVMPY
ncbi:MAG: hypothetical protein RMJ07_04230 [Nitrososphaerota archaeon]|nr:OPT/YSL family transporter [Candidatus Bathyarchaeota archaeon]MDW8048871.1 hypothetical protein [Nitrososphaerota archaeon]